MNEKINYNDATALILASQNGHLETVKCLVKNGADVNAIDKDSNETALIWASRNCHYEIAKYLIENGAYVNANDRKRKRSNES